ncbi:MAG: DUF922 domain-containing protein [Rhizobiaceae bacterium]|nr:DUF922 domain-containing protein [Rhizobiaceae bacterium]
MVISRPGAQRTFGYVSTGSAEIAICSPAWRLLDQTLRGVGVTLRVLIPLALATALASPAAAQWRAVEKVETYAISGATGRELYDSIGERGPKLGPTRAIAHTNFKLTWQRRYVPKGGACTLVAARPKLVITYLVPKPAGPLPAAARARWETFIAGIEAHERVHGDMIKDLVHEIERVSVGLTAENDPGCTKVRADLQQRLAALSQAQRQRSRDFDRDEMSDGGNVHRLILGLIGGG